VDEKMVFRSQKNTTKQTRREGQKEKFRMRVAANARPWRSLSQKIRLCGARGWEVFKTFSRGVKEVDLRGTITGCNFASAKGDSQLPLFES